jgi:hypothetical protein
MTFRRSLFGYNRRAVDQYVGEQEAVHGRYLEQQALHSRYVAEQAAARRTLDAEIESLRAAEPMLKVNQEVSSLLTSFASTVSTMREQAEREASHTRTEADGYAEHRREEADRMFHDQRARAAAVADQTVRAARTEAVTLAQNQAAVEQSLREVAQGVFAWLTTLERLKEATHLPDVEQVTPPDAVPTPGHPAGAGAPSGPATPPSPSAPGDAPAVAPEPGGASPAAAGPEPPDADPERGKIVDFRPRPDPPGNGGN